MFSPIIRVRLMGLTVLVLVVLLDQLSKASVLHAAESFTLPREVLPFFTVVLVHNRGISFGLFGQLSAWGPLILTGLTSVVAIALTVWLLRVQQGWTALALGLVIGGAIGNIADRLRFGSVTDFLDFHLNTYHWPAFNLADSAICMGVVILVLMSIVGPSEAKETTK